MPVFAATDYNVTINGTNFSSFLRQVELTVESEDLETTSFQSGWRTRTGGLRQGSITLEFMQDFAAGAVDATLWPLFNSNATVAIRPTSSAISATNPAFTAVALVTQYSPFASSVGDLATLSVTWPVSGTVTRATA